MPLTGDGILGLDDLPREEVQVPEWKCSVWVRTFSGWERDQYEHWLLEHQGDDGELKSYSNVRALLVCLTACDEQGTRLFRDDQVDAVGRKSAAALDRIFTVAMRLNGLSKKDVEALEKN